MSWLASRWDTKEHIDEKSTLGRVMAWRHQTTSHYLVHCEPGSWRQVASLFLKCVQYISYIVDIKFVDGLVLSVIWFSAGMALDKMTMNNFPSLNGTIDIHDSQCILRCKANHKSNVFQQIIQAHNKTNKKAPQHWCLRENHLSTMFSPQKWVANAAIPIDGMTVTQHIVTQYGDPNLSTLTRIIACCLTEPNHYLNQCWLIIDKVQWPVSEGNFIGETSANND